MEQAHHPRITPTLGHRIKIRLEIAEHDVAMAVNQLEAGFSPQLEAGVSRQFGG